MLIDEVKATLAMENLKLTSEEEVMLKSYAEGRISFEEFKAYLLKTLKKDKAA